MMPFVVPVTRARIPINISMTLRITTWLYRPNPNGYNTQISINAGKATPSMDKHNAPNSEMNRPKLFTVIARLTVRKK